MFYFKITQTIFIDSITPEENEHSKSEEKEEFHYIDKKLDTINGKGYFDWLIALPVGFGYCISLSYLVPFLIQIPALI